MIEVEARAKLNLSLRITGRRGDIHTLDSVIIPVSLSDTVRIRKRTDGQINVCYSGKKSVYKNDTALSVAEKISLRYGTGGADIDIVKRIPEQAGMGGSSADAAGVARGMELIYGYGATDPSILTSVGSDVLAMYYDRPCRVRGTGERVSEVNPLKEMYFVAVRGKRGVSTKTCYARYDELGGEDGDIEKVIAALESGEYFIPDNDLYKAAADIEPEIRDARKLLDESGFISGMTGSGNAVFGYEYDRMLFENKLKRLKKIVNGKFEILTF